MSTADKTDNSGTRTERDMLGAMTLPASALYGIHAARAMENFSLSGRRVHRELIHAYGAVKLACARVNRELGVWPDAGQADAIEQACAELAEGALDEHILVDALQGGAGTSTNMNVNEVIANRALILLRCEPGNANRVSPLEDINRHQSTNDTYPTALRVAAIRMLRRLEQAIVGLQESFQRKEKEFAGIVKIGRTELQDAVFVTLGRAMGAYAEVFSRDRWRIYKCEERLRVVNLGGTAIGTGIGAPRRFIFRATEVLREITGLGLARAENLLDATQNVDAFVEVSGMLKTLAVSLIKISNDLRLLSSGPVGGFGELRLLPLQAGSSIMPGKVNPVAPEAAAQAALLALGHDAAIAAAAAGGNLELNPFLPLIAHSLLESLHLLTEACRLLDRACVASLRADEECCRRGIESPTALLTALMAEFGYEKALAIAATAQREGVSIRQAALNGGGLTAEEFDRLTSPENVCRLGSPHGTEAK
jgi:aspartate ammonia-lyase